MAVYNLLAVPILGLIAWEDLRERSVHWWLLPLLPLTLLIEPYLNGAIIGRGHDAAINTAVVAVVLVGAWSLISVKRGRWMNPFRDSIGSGDLFFLLATAWSLPASQFTVYLISGMVMALAAWTLVLRYVPKQASTVPLAGLLALHLILWLTWTQIEVAFNLGIADSIDLRHG